MSIFEDSQGNFWFGSWGGGANMYNGETIDALYQKQGLISNIVRTILEDSQGNIWFGTIEGLCKYNGETFTHFTQKEGLSDNNIYFQPGGQPWQSLVWNRWRRCEHVRW